MHYSVLKEELLEGLNIQDGKYMLMQRLVMPEILKENIKSKYQMVFYMVLTKIKKL